MIFSVGPAYPSGSQGQGKNRRPPARRQGSDGQHNDRGYQAGTFILALLSERGRSRFPNHRGTNLSLSGVLVDQPESPPPPALRHPSSNVTPASARRKPSRSPASWTWFFRSSLASRIRPRRGRSAISAFAPPPLANLNPKLLPMSIKVVNFSARPSAIPLRRTPALPSGFPDDLRVVRVVEAFEAADPLTRNSRSRYCKHTRRPAVCTPGGVQRPIQKPAIFGPKITVVRHRRVPATRSARTVPNQYLMIIKLNLNTHDLLLFYFVSLQHE